MSDKQPELHLNDFEGPLEVLLHLIQQSKMDIYDIKIAEITDQYMRYIYDAEELNLDIIGEYFVMAAKLMLIKSKMLLPQVTEDVEEEPEDPREELVEQLITYQKYKQITPFLKTAEEKRRQSYTRPPVEVEATPEILEAPSLFNSLDLMAAYVDALKRFRYNQPMETVVHEWEYTIEGQTELIRKLLGKKSSSFTFKQLAERAHATEEVVTDFLALLEMAKYQEVKLVQKDMNSTIEIMKGDIASGK
ncbi:segregation/condensation protein A [Lentilactobacillus sp. Marseille-Q4993]|uniref:segregation and condensation protein A n=1 Tax=Lentilactobacillus sp. Marseille-Q4993 TaxID=3039492 RepID=UPI0024BD4480|nr:segregation/condensation protein A [Lentilactobacillus sp. Marseille-Q4993]